MADPKKDNSEQNQDPKKQDDKQEVKTDIQFDNRDSQVAATVSLNQVFTLMHEKALKEASSAVGNVEIVNSAVNDKGKFLGAGQHVIIAQPKADDLIKEDCLKAIQTYVQWFSGPDVAKTITLDSLTPLTRPLTDEEKNKDLKKAQDDKESEAKGNPTKKDTENKPKKKTEKEKNKEQVANESLETYIYQIDNNMFSILFESTQQQDEEDAKKDGLKITGYQAQYQLDIPGQKTQGFAQTMKDIGKYFAKGLANQLGGIGFQSWDWRSGAKGEVHKLGDMAKKLTKKISPDKLVSAVKEEFSKKFPGNSIDLAVLDSKSIVNHLAKRLPSADKGKILKIPYALCIKVNKNDKNYELVNKKAIAKFVKEGLSKIKENLINLNFKTWQKISENDVILVNNYTDQHYNPDANKHGQANANAKKIKTKEENIDAKAGVSNESVEDVFKMYKMIFENLDLTDLENYIAEQLLIDESKRGGKKPSKAQRQKDRDRSRMEHIKNQNAQILRQLQSKKDSKDADNDKSNEENQLSDEEKAEQLRKDKATKLEDKDYEDIASKINEFYKNSDLAKQNDKLVRFIKHEKDKLTKAIAEILSENKDGNINKDILASKLKGINFDELKELRDNTENYLQNFEIKVDNFENSNENTEALKKKIMPIKYLYVKNNIQKLLDKNLLKDFDFDIKFNNIDTKQLDNDKVVITDGKISDEDYEKLSNIIPISNKETTQFEEFSDADFEECISQLQSEKVKEANEKLKDSERKDKSTNLEDKDYEDIAAKIKQFIIDNKLEDEKEKLENLKNNSKDELDKQISLLLSQYKSSNKKADITGTRLKNKIENVDFNELKNLRDNTDGYLKDLLIKLDNTKKSDNKANSLKMAIMPIKFRYIKYRVDKLKEKGYYKPEGKLVDFEIPTNQNTLDFIASCKGKKFDSDKKNETNGRYNFTKEIYDELNKQIPITDDEVKKFEGFTNKDFEQARNNVLNDAGKPTQIALQKLATEIKDKFDKIKDEKTKQKLFPGVNGKKELEKKLDDKNSNIWDLGVTRMFEVLDDINQKEADREGNKQALDKTKTDKDMYIIPIAGLDFDSKK